MTALGLVTSSLRLIGALAPGEVPTADEANDGLMVLNDMIDGWNNQRMMIFTIQRQVFNIISGQQAYTVGAGGDFNIPRPPRIERAGIITLNNPAQPLELPLEMLTDAEWQSIPVKNITSTIPLKVWDDGGYPLRTLSYWCIPQVDSQTALYTWTALTQFADLTTDYTFPPGYSKALRYNLAVDLSPEFGQPLNPAVAGIASQSKAEIKSFNAPLVDLTCDPAVVNPKLRVYNWLTDGQGVSRG